MSKHLYHAAPSEKAESIRKRGLHSQSGKIYLWERLDVAEWFKDIHESDGTSMSIWIVEIPDPSRLEIDSETIDMSEWSMTFERGEFGGGYIFPESIGPEHLMGVL